MKQYKLQTHDEAFSAQEVIINPTKFKEIQIGDVLKITQEVHSIIFHIKVASIDLVKGITDISLSKDVITKNQFDLDAPVLVEKNTTDISLSHLELRIKDQFLSGGDMWKLKKHLLDQTVYCGKYLEENGVRATVIQMSRNGQHAKSGLITASTKITFRSLSGHIYWLIQMSKEMWEYSLNGDLHFEKSINFFGELYDKWSQEKVNHSVKILLFSRYYLLNNEKNDTKIDSFYALNGNKYHDFYKFITLNLKKTTREQLLIMLKREFIDFPKQINKLFPKEKLINSNASEGNILEAMNLVFHQYEERHLNRDMQRTGTFIHILTAGQGLITINNPDIAYITQHMIITESFTVDLVCLAHPPTHGVPILRGKNEETNEDFYIFAYWLDIMFYKNDSLLSKKFIPTCKIPRLKKPSTIQVFNVDENAPPIDKDFKLDIQETTLDSLFPLDRTLRKPSKMKKSTSHDEIFVDDTDSKISTIQFNSPSKLSNPELLNMKKSSFDVGVTQSLGKTSFMNQIPKSYSPNVNFLIYCNPFDLAEFENQSFYIKKKSKQTKQWSHLFPTVSNLVHNRIGTTNSDSLMKMFEFQWKGLIEPAVLPVTNDFWPSNDELNDKYVDFTYSLTIEDPNTIQEMIAQRLNHSFQLFELGLKYIHSKSEHICQLSNEDELQTISYDPDDDQVLIIKRYESKSNEQKSIDYEYKIFFNQGFTDSKIQLTKSKSYPWNHLDFTLTETSMIGANLNPSTLQFHLIPNEKNSVETRVSNFKQLLESVLSRSLIPANNSKFDVKFVSDEEEYKSKMNILKLVSSKKKINTWANLLYKSSYHPKEAFKMQLVWISCRPSLISEFIVSFSRRAKQFNFNLFQTSIFLKTSCFSMRSDPIFELKNEENGMKMKEMLVENFQFYPEERNVKACKTFIHESGSVITYFFDTSFSWIVNDFETININTGELYHKVLNVYKEMTAL